MQSVAKISQISLRRTASTGRCAAGYYRRGRRGAVESRPQKAHSPTQATGSQPAMTVARFPQLAHWGASPGWGGAARVSGCGPFARAPARSNMLDATPEMVHSPLRIARPAIRDGWREGKERTGADRFHEVSWDEALAAV